MSANQPSIAFDPMEQNVVILFQEEDGKVFNKLADKYFETNLIPRLRQAGLTQQRMCGGNRREMSECVAVVLRSNIKEMRHMEVTGLHAHEFRLALLVGRWRVATALEVAENEAAENHKREADRLETNVRGELRPSASYEV